MNGILLLVALLMQQPTCGVERWSVKTMTDPDRDRVALVPVATTIDSLRGLAAPDVRHLPGRAPLEFHVFTVRALAIGWKTEGDADIHLVIAAPSDTTRTMIAEFPDSLCAQTDVEAAAQGMRLARRVAVSVLGRPTSKFRRFRHPVPIILTGVGFFDFIHGQTGVAPNGIELHPVLAIAFAAPADGGSR